MMAGAALAPSTVAFADDGDQPSSPAAAIIRESDRGVAMSSVDGGGEVRHAEMGKVLGGVTSKAALILENDGNLASVVKHKPFPVQ
jgi:hypothetical protein